MDSKKLLVTGVLTPKSIGFQIGKLALEQGHQVFFTYNPRHEKHARRALASLATPLQANFSQLGVDLTSEADLAALATQLPMWLGGEQLAGALHGAAFAPQSALGSEYYQATWEDVSLTMQTSVFTFPRLIREVAGQMGPGSSVVTLTFASMHAWPGYGWMGAAKAALENTVRYLARDLGPRGVQVNALSAGPILTAAASSIPDFTAVVQQWSRFAPLGWDVYDASAVARCALSLLTGIMPAISGQVIHVDGGYSSQGAPLE